MVLNFWIVFEKLSIIASSKISINLDLVFIVWRFKKKMNALSELKYCMNFINPDINNKHIIKGFAFNKGILIRHILHMRTPCRMCILYLQIKNSLNQILVEWRPANISRLCNTSTNLQWRVFFSWFCWAFVASLIEGVAKIGWLDKNKEQAICKRH